MRRIRLRRRYVSSPPLSLSFSLFFCVDAWWELFIRFENKWLIGLGPKEKLAYHNNIDLVEQSVQSSAVFKITDMSEALTVRKELYQ